jgi:hypothetical protein
MNTKINNAVFSNAHHPAKKYCEWWYFTLFFEPKSVISGIFKIENKTPEIWIFIKKENQAPVYIRKKFPYKSFSASEKCCEVRIGDNIFVEKNGAYQVKINFPELTLDVVFKRTLIWDDNLIERPLSKKEKISWLVPCVKGEFSGKLILAGKTETISGLAFHDHVWHNINAIKMLRNFKEWFWGISYSAKETLLYVDVNLGKRGDFKFVFFSDGKKNLKIIDGLDAKNSHWNKVLKKLKLVEKDSVNTWGDSILIKFFTNKLLGFSQYHCFGNKDYEPENWDYIEILQRGRRSPR